jgi:aryl-alcohol dehydrogenase-like predicted oxidoreductase
MQRTLGATNLRVSPLGIGLAALGRPGYITLDHAQDLNQQYAVEAMAAHAHAVLDAAYAGGVRYFDAARSYGKAELFLRSWLDSRNLAPDAVSVGSKWGYTYTADWQVHAEAHEVKEHSLAVLRRQWHESQETLGNYLDLYQVHSATLQSGILTNEPVLQELARLKSQGVIIGLSVSGEDQAEVIERAMDVRVDGERLFQSVQATWNLLERSAGSALAAAHREGIGVIVKEALANGRLTDRNHKPDFAAKMVLLQQEAERLATTVDALALAAVLAQPWTDVVLSGAARVEHVESNLKALAVAWDGTADDGLASLREPASVYWQRRSELAWN